MLLQVYFHSRGVVTLVTLVGLLGRMHPSFVILEGVFKPCGVVTVIAIVPFLLRVISFVVTTEVARNTAGVVAVRAFVRLLPGMYFTEVSSQTHGGGGRKIAVRT